MDSRYIFAERAGGPDVLEFRKQKIGPPGPNEARVRVRAVGVSGGDILFLAGAVPVGPKPPFTPGFDITGVVESVGSQVTDLYPGQQVTALVKGGGFTEIANVPADRLVPVPEGLDAVSVAATTLNYFIAHQMLHRVAKVRPGHRIMVHAAAGGVGLAILQLARLAEVECYGTSSAKKAHMVTELGAHHIDYHAEDFLNVVQVRESEGLHAALDPIGGTHFLRSYRLLRRGGILIGYGQDQVLQNGKVRKGLGAFGFLLGMVAPKIIPDGKSTMFYNAWSLEKGQPAAYREDLGEVLRLLEEKKITPRIAETLPLADAAKALEILGRASVLGKIVLLCGDE